MRFSRQAAATRSIEIIRNRFACSRRCKAPGVDHADDAFKNNPPGNIPKGDDGQFPVAMRGSREDVSSLRPGVSGWWTNPEYPACTRLN
jgi:hypothetical protein